MKLTSENVHKTFMDCLFEEGEETKHHIVAHGVQMKVGFNPERIKKNEALITEMLSDLPDDFKREGGGGMSFLNMAVDKEGSLWTGFHKTVDELVCLGSAIGKLSFLMPREMWGMLPGGVPYLVVDLNQNK